LAEESIQFFEWLGLIQNGDSIEFPLLPLAEMSAAFGIVAAWKWKTEETEHFDDTMWRQISFAATVARRRGETNILQENIQRYSDGLRIGLQKTGNGMERRLAGGVYCYQSQKA